MPIQIQNTKFLVGQEPDPDIARDRKKKLKKTK
jgi:hypothetical protein